MNLGHLLRFLFGSSQQTIMSALLVGQSTSAIRFRLSSFGTTRLSQCLPPLHCSFRQAFGTTPISTTIRKASVEDLSSINDATLSVVSSQSRFQYNDTSGEGGGVAVTAMATSSVLIASSVFNNNQDDPTTTMCEASSEIIAMPFPEECIKEDTYNGVSMDVSALPTCQTLDGAIFSHNLSKAMGIWKQQAKRGVWLIIPTEYSHLIPLAIKLDFDFQYAEKGKVILTSWLPSTPSRLPFGPTHQVGVGALVLHPTTGQMLVVQEKSGPAAARKLWKMPTGLADPGEDIIDAVVREVKEETGLDCVFDHIVCFRQAHFSSKSDLFFVCHLKLADKYVQELHLGNEIKLHPQEAEIAEVKWADIGEYFSQPLWLSSPVYTIMNEALTETVRRVHHRDLHQTDNVKKAGVVEGVFAESLTKSGDFIGFVGKRLPVGFNPGHNTIYFVETNHKKPDKDGKAGL